MNTYLSGIQLIKMKIGEKLLNKGLITKDHVEIGILHQEVFGGMFGEIMLDLGYINKKELEDVLDD